MTGNFFKIDRAIFNHSIWQDPVQFRIFFYLIGKAVFAKDGLMVGNVHIPRGSVLKSYRRLRDELEYIENNAVKKYSLSKIHRALEKLEAAEMIRKHETELGTLFEVVNYAKYQDKQTNEMEAWNGTQNADGTQMEQGWNNNKNVKKEKKEKNDKEIRSKYKFETHHMELAEHLLMQIKENYPDFKEPNLKSWAVTFRLMIDRDKRKSDAIKNCIDWVTGHDFWHKNILSADKLRKQYDRLCIEAKEDQSKVIAIGGKQRENDQSSYEQEYSKYNFRKRNM